MSTRAVYTFKDQFGDFSVYKHHDGYPEGAREWIAKALPHAWPLPRFEANEFGAAFVVANKDSGGAIRLTSGPDAHGDLEYRYEISHDGTDLRIKAFCVYDGWHEIFNGTLTEFQAWEEPED